MGYPHPYEKAPRGPRTTTSPFNPHALRSVLLPPHRKGPPQAPPPPRAHPSNPRFPISAVMRCMYHRHHRSTVFWAFVLERLFESMGPTHVQPQASDYGPCPCPPDRAWTRVASMRQAGGQVMSPPWLLYLLCSIIRSILTSQNLPNSMPRT